MNEEKSDKQQGRINKIEREMHLLMEVFQQSFGYLKNLEEKAEKDSEQEEKIKEFGKKLLEHSSNIQNDVDNLQIFSLMYNQNNLNNITEKQRIEAQQQFLQEQNQILEFQQRQREISIQEFQKSKKNMEDLNNKFKIAIESVANNFYDCTE